MASIDLGYNSPRWTGEIADCSLPMTLDTYSNCSFGCVYCFSQFQRGIHADGYFEKKVKAVNPAKIKKIFSGEDKNNQFYNWIKDRRPVQYGGLSDQFDGFEKKYGVTYEILKYLREIEYPISFSTKATWIFDDERYRDLFRGADNWNMKISIITLDEDDARKIEVGVPSPLKRIKAMEKYNELSKGGVTLRLRPFILGVSNKTYIDLIKQAADAGANALSTEFFCLENRSVKQSKRNYEVISDCCGFDVVDFYRKFSNRNGYLRLNRNAKEKYVYKMKDLAHKLGMRFYISDSHFKECSDGCCCCGLPAEWDYSRGHFNGALQIAKKNGKVTWSEIEKDMDHLVAKAETVIHFADRIKAGKFNGMNIKEYMRYLWNSPKEGNSPYKIFEMVLVPDGIDDHGDIIYKYNESVTFEKQSENAGYELKEI